MVKLTCLNCKYEFEVEGKPNNCPYCGKEKLEQEKSASDMIEEVRSLIGD